MTLRYHWLIYKWLSLVLKSSFFMLLRMLYSSNLCVSQIKKCSKVVLQIRVEESTIFQHILDVLIALFQLILLLYPHQVVNHLILWLKCLPFLSFIGKMLAALSNRKKDLYAKLAQNSCKLSCRKRKISN